MLYYNIKPDIFPEIVFAHSLTKQNYQRDDDTVLAQDHIEITYIKSGAVKLNLQNTEFVAQEGSFLVLCHSSPFTLHTVENEVHIHYTVAFDLGSGVSLLNDSRLADLHRGDGITVPVHIPPCSKTEGYLKQLNDIIKVYHSPRPLSGIKAGCMTTQLLCDLAISISEKEEPSNPFTYHSQNIYSDRIKNYINRHLTSDISLADISAAIGKSPNYLNHVFKEINDITIRQYINLERTKKAAELILKEQYSLKQAAEKVGVHDANYLSRMFKKQFGVSVSEFKNNSLESTYSLIDPKKEIF